MRRWIYVTLARVAAVVVILILLGLLLIYKPRSDARHTIRSQARFYQSASTDTKKADSLISSLPDISVEGTQRPGNFSSFVSDCNSRLKQLEGTSIAYTKPRKIFSLGKSPLITSVNSAAAASGGSQMPAANSLKQAGGLLGYHCKVMAALANVLEYNPAQDMQGFQPGSDDSNQRLNLARKGLDKTSANLSSQRGKYKDAGFNELQRQVGLLQSARSRLGQDGNTQDWIGTFTKAQQVIAGNRQLFWQENLQKIHPALQQQAESLAKRYNLWFDIATKFNVTVK